jgi:hypothetical protein
MLAVNLKLVGAAIDVVSAAEIGKYCVADAGCVMSDFATDRAPNVVASIGA